MSMASLNRLRSSLGIRLRLHYAANGRAFQSLHRLLATATCQTLAVAKREVPRLRRPMVSDFIEHGGPISQAPRDAFKDCHR
jgi:hypothetical protein